MSQPSESGPGDRVGGAADPEQATAQNRFESGQKQIAAPAFENGGTRRREPDPWRR